MGSISLTNAWIDKVNQAIQEQHESGEFVTTKKVSHTELIELRYLLNKLLELKEGSTT